MPGVAGCVVTVGVDGVGVGFGVGLTGFIGLTGVGLGSGGIGGVGVFFL